MPLQLFDLLVVDRLLVFDEGDLVLARSGHVSCHEVPTGARKYLSFPPQRWGMRAASPLSGDDLPTDVAKCEQAVGRFMLPEAGLFDRSFE